MNYAEVFDPNRGTFDFLFHGLGLVLLLYIVGLIFAGIAKLLK